MKLLALDLATQLGWASWDGETVRFGHEQLPPPHGQDYGRMFHSYRTWLRSMIAVDRPDCLFFERASVMDQSMENAVMILVGLAAHTLEIAFDKKIHWKHIAVSSVRKHFCGSGRAKKHEVGTRCRELGFEVSNHNAADAIALLDYARKHPIALSTPLFPEGMAAR